MKKSHRNLFFILCTFFAVAIVAVEAATKQKEKTYETIVSRRERNLDHWDAETLAAYLGLDPNTAKPLPNSDQYYAGIDASIMFYAQWCTNCHKFAPVWDTIGQLLKAGTTQSNLIMALFNCELNERHTRLCDASGVTHYPTIMFIGAGPYADSDPVSSFILGGKDKASGPFGGTKLKRTVKFQGNLNVGDSVLDWIRTMQGLSKWHKWGHMDGGWLKTIRSLFFNPFERKKGKEKSKENALPVGIPPALGGAYNSKSVGTGTEGTKSNYVLQKELDEAEGEVNKMEKELEQYKFANDHAGNILESFLFPKMANTSDEETSNKTLDTFTVLYELNGWDAAIDKSDNNSDTDTASKTEEGSKKSKKQLSLEDDKSLIIKACVVDLSLDYCTRVSKKLTTEYLDSLSSLAEDKYPSFTEMETELRGIIKDKEPFCAAFDDCYAKRFEGEECRPSTCPYKNDAACTYLGSCLTDSLMKEYRDVIQKKLVDDLESKPDKNTGSSVKK